MELFEDAERKQRYSIIQNNLEPLVSIDFTGSQYSAVVDHRWTAVQGGRQLKLVVWYDNEFSYSNRLIDLGAIFSGASATQNARPNVSEIREVAPAVRAALGRWLSI